MWKSKTGLPDFAAAAWASASVLCHFTLPGSTVGLFGLDGAAGVVAGAVPATSPDTAGSMRRVLLKSAGLAVVFGWCNRR